MKSGTLQLRWLAALLLLLAPLALSTHLAGQVSIGIGIQIGPPALPVYVQPPCPEPNLIWTPGYWAWGPYGYYWVPGAWIMPPEPGLLWTPGWWGWNDDAYYWHPGYWGPRVGFYGGINYGYGYFGYGYVGGYWDRDRFFYNRDVNRIDDRYVHDVYYRHVDRREFNQRRISFNGPRGIRAQASPEQLQAAHERRFGATRMQRQQVQLAGRDRGMFARYNHGRPPVAAVSRPGQFRTAAPRGPQRQWQHFSPARGNAPGRGQRGWSQGGGQHGWGHPAGRGFQGRPQAGRPSNRANAPQARGWGHRGGGTNFGQRAARGPANRGARGGFGRPAYARRGNGNHPYPNRQFQRGPGPGRHAGGRPAPRVYSRPAYRPPARGRGARTGNPGHSHGWR